MRKEIIKMATKLHLKGQTFLADKSGSETTEKFGWIAIVVVIIAVIVGLVGGDDGIIARFLNSIFGKAQSTFEGFFPG